jgi:hypothetical protein
LLLLARLSYLLFDSLHDFKEFVEIDLSVGRVAEPLDIAGVSLEGVHNSFQVLLVNVTVLLFVEQIKNVLQVLYFLFGEGFGLGISVFFVLRGVLLVGALVFFTVINGLWQLGRRLGRLGVFHLIKFII